jgi:hypothetical protein
MAGWFRRPKPIPPDAIDTLLNHLVQPDEIHTKQFMALVGDRQDAFLKKYYLYQIALTASCLAACERTDNRFSPILRRLEETVIYPRVHAGEWSQSSFAAAMRELADLAKSEGSGEKGLPELAWARQWFADLGVQITNVVEGSLFVIGWQQSIYYTAKLFQDIGEAY